MNLSKWWSRIQESSDAIRGGLWGSGIAFLVAATLTEDGFADYHGLRSLGAALVVFALVAALAGRQRTIPSALP